MSEVVLIVDDDPVQRRLLEAMVQRFGYRTLLAEGGDVANALLTGPDAPKIDCTVLDLVMPDLDGLGVLARMREAGVDIPVIVQTAHGGIDNVVSAMRAGAADFVVKPAKPERLQVSLRNALAARRLAGELQRLKRKQDGTLSLADVITRSQAMQPVLRAAEKVAASTIAVLIEGESGTGKEMIARAIHGSGARRAKPFVAVNCGALPENLVEFDPVRPREGRLHRRHRKAHRQIRRGRRRHAVPRRGRRIAAGRAGQAPARAAGRRGRAGRRPQTGEGRRAHCLGHQPRPDRRREGRALPRGPVLSPARVSDFGAAAAPAGGGHARARPPFPRAHRGGGRQAGALLERAGAGAAFRLPLAGQCAPARERHLPRRRAGRRRGAWRQRIPADRRALPAPTRRKCWSSRRPPWRRRCRSATSRKNRHRH